MHIKDIFIDLDDTLNQFTMYALRWVGCLTGKLDESLHPGNGNYDIVEAANIMKPYLQFTHDIFWNEITRRVWRCVPKSLEFDMLLAESEALVGRKHITILTAPTEDPGCLAGKLEWIHENLPEWLHRQYIMTTQKHLLAHVPGALLIDDSDNNIKAFQQVGGQTLTVPRPWNRLHEYNALKYLSNYFRYRGREAT